MSEQERSISQPNASPQSSLGSTSSTVTLAPEPTHLLLKPAIARIAEFAELPRDWDADDADPITARAIARAVDLVLRAGSAPKAARERIPRLAIPVTSAPLPDGGIQVEWSNGTDRIDVQISPVGGLGYLMKWGSGRDVRYEEADNASEDQIIERIHQIIWPKSKSSRG